MMSVYHEVCHQCSALVTRGYSTSFSAAIRLLHRDLRQPIHNIYGFVRFADEIVDTFHTHDKAGLLQEFTESTYKAIGQGISLNPILHSFQQVVRQYNIPHHLINAFLQSMALDLHKTDYNTTEEIDHYIYGSAEAVGLMCLCIFCEGDTVLYDKLTYSAQKLGAAFQKVNFLRDIQTDHKDLNRTYFPQFNFYAFDAKAKERIEADIESDFKESLAGIRGLPLKARFGVYTAYRYYYTLFRKIRRMQPQKILEQRVRVPDYQKLYIVFSAGMYNRFNMF